PGEYTYDVSFVSIPGTLFVRPGPGSTVAVSYSLDGDNFTAVPVTGWDALTEYDEVIITSGIRKLRFTLSGAGGGSWGVV
ncbi:MAG: hypothetical protein N2422_13550, partial [Rhodobacteraceae bacterium]|nr:hypothetical protein [Paracoccaceae bacterium]